MVRVKICGITREEDLRVALEAGADAVGFIVGFETSPRNISLRRAGEMISLVPPLVDSVLVTTDEVLAGRARQVCAIGPDAIQLYGKKVDAEATRRATGATMIRPYLVGREARSAREEASGFDAVLVDGSRNGMQGGTGSSPDWRVCAKIVGEVKPLPLILSGGLKPGNVARAIAAVRPYAVDVSSGVEASPGRKDPVKVKAFVKRAKETPR